MKAWRIIFAVSGLLLVAFGLYRFGTEISFSTIVWVVVWMAAAIAIHDGLFSPLVVGIGLLLRRLVPDRARRFLQVGLIMGVMVTVLAVPMIYLRGSMPAAKAILTRNYGANLTLLLGIIAVVSLVLYAIRVARDKRAAVAEAPTPQA